MPTLSDLILLWLLIWNLAAFALMGWDKHRAKTGGWRVKEATLFLSAILGGSVGAILGMQLFRHKTKHWYFKFGMPAILVLQLGIALWLRGRGRETATSKTSRPFCWPERMPRVIRPIR